MKRPIIILRIFGGLGNQLFCYAAARRMALTNNIELVIDDVSGFIRDHTYQRHYQLDNFNIPCRKATSFERLEPFSRVRRVLMRKFNQRLPFAQRTYIQQQSVEFDSRMLQVKPKGTLYLEGYWQSEKYFKDVSVTIRQDLKIRPPTDETNMAMADHIRSHTAVAIHVRFFDEPRTMAIYNAPTDYYTRAIAEMVRLVPNAHYYLFSDRPEVARDRIPLPDERITLVAHNHGDAHACADLWLMTHCQHFITANSTFSWWGAWLSDSAAKIVMTPAMNFPGLSTWGKGDLIPDGWLQIKPIH